MLHKLLILSLLTDELFSINNTINYFLEFISLKLYFTNENNINYSGVCTAHTVDYSAQPCTCSCTVLLLLSSRSTWSRILCNTNNVKPAAIFCSISHPVLPLQILRQVPQLLHCSQDPRQSLHW